MTEASLPVAAHLAELRTRLCWVAVMFFSLFGIAFWFRISLLGYLQPTALTLTTLTPTEGFEVQVLVAIIAALLGTLPVATWHGYRFLMPASKETGPERQVQVMAGISMLLVVGSVVYTQEIIIPTMIRFFRWFNDTASLQEFWSANAYVQYVLWNHFIFAVLFQLPIAVYIIAQLTHLSAKDLWRQQRMVVLGLVSIIAVITPSGDAVTLLLIALPLLVLYYCTIAVLWWRS